jgi:hypothetical protein
VEFDRVRLVISQSFAAMKQGRSIVIILVALAIGFAAGFMVRPVIGPAAGVIAAPRATQYFAVNLDQAREIVAGCRAGTVRGDECAHAEEAIIAAEAQSRTEAFLGTRPH